MPADALASRRLRGGFAPPSPAHLAGWLWPLTGGHRWPGAGSPHGLRERAPGRTSPEGALLLLSMRDGRKQSACPPPSRPCCLVHEAGCGQLAGQALGSAAPNLNNQGRSWRSPKSAIDIDCPRKFHLPRPVSTGWRARLFLPPTHPPGADRGMAPAHQHKLLGWGLCSWPLRPTHVR